MLHLSSTGLGHGDGRFEGSLQGHCAVEAVWSPREGGLSNQLSQTPSRCCPLLDLQGLSSAPSTGISQGKGVGEEVGRKPLSSSREQTWPLINMSSL